jgi:hypothetical protein
MIVPITDDSERRIAYKGGISQMTLIFLVEQYIAEAFVRPFRLVCKSAKDIKEVGTIIHCLALKHDGVVGSLVRDDRRLVVGYHQAEVGWHTQDSGTGVA